MTGEETRILLAQVEARFEQEGKLIKLESGRVVFVGDTHGDLEATRTVIARYLNPKSQIVFLGDYVDRGPKSAENLNSLLRLKLKHPDNLFLLMGNHEGQGAIAFHPADFWEGLDCKLHTQYATVLSRMPLVASTPNGIIALHGALPNVETLEDLEKIDFGGRQWQQITWGDWQEKDGGNLGNDPFTGRPQFGQGWFDEMMKRLGKNVLIRSHQPNARQVMYGRRCLTIFTSSAYRELIPHRTIAIADLEREVKTVDDLVIETV
ncbi:metallophosphoesterase [Dehalococcoidia bacterium]|nr:metallophosphoesterase [Dehalococcoidia bacterium]MCL0064459.1 metallophosphoesterase [Dehalococcoidia bacterium]